MVLNVDRGRLYIVGFPPHTLEFRTYGATNPPYFGFIWENDTWKRIPFPAIPEAIYGSNMMIESIPSNKVNFLGLEKKNSEAENGNPVYPKYLRKIDPKYTTSAH